MEDLKPLGGQQTPEEILQQYFGGRMLEELFKPPPFGYNLNIRNADYYAKHEPEPLNPDTHCVHCGHALEDPDY